MRIIPSKTNVQTQFFKGVGLLDALVGLVGITIASLIFLSNISHKGIYIISVLIFFAILLCTLDDNKTYVLFYNIIKYYARPRIYSKKPEGKESSIFDIMPFTKICNDVIEYGNKYSAAVFEIPSIEFKFYSERKQNFMIDKMFGSVIRSIAGEQSASLVKIDRPILYDKYMAIELEKIEEIKKTFTNGLINKQELEERIKIINARIDEIDRLNNKQKIMKPFHYFVFYEKDPAILNQMIASSISQFKENGMDVKRLNTKELAIFLKYNFSYDFNEREIENIPPEKYTEWIMPEKLKIKSRTIEYEDKVFYTMKITNYPTIIGNAWGHSIFNIPNTKVVMKINTTDKFKATRDIDKSIDELRSQQMTTGKTSRIIELSAHVNSLANLLTLLNGDNETLYQVNTYVTIYDNIQSDELKRINEAIKKIDSSAAEISKHEKPNKKKKKTSQVKLSSVVKTTAKKYVKRLFNESSFKIKDLFLEQFDGYVGSQVSGYDPFRKKSQNIHSTSIAAVFPFVYSSLADENGVNIGNSENIPVFVDFFARSTERVNSNMVIIGKSGSGKSFATKTILTNLAAEDSKIFILDPENEYSGIAKKMHGKVIDVGSATQGRLNPFHIITSLSDDETDDSVANSSTSFSVHLQFLEEFFKQILTGIDSDAQEYLNNILIRTYEEKGISSETNLNELKAENFPNFDDLYEKILADFQTSSGDYSKNNLRILLNYISKFATGGRNSNLWNGESTISTNENFIVFNFQSLLANKNNTIANAQMLLVLKWLDNEVIKNRDYNIKYSAKRKIIVVIDEAHVFIDEKFPVALDFMFQLAKRIRKYSGMQIIITQNVKDFVGTEELARKSTAIINACQYSFIFPLAPSDMNDLVKLYEKAGEINDTEQEQIINNGRGRAFVVISPTNRTTINIIAPDDIKNLFE
ncbi:MAG: DUF87 domain-containing protein [Clostridiales bacterium]|jgi:hypothetical protein|nr:DUF87 domain-containing protein [Clostridiales bacterium]